MQDAAAAFCLDGRLRRLGILIFGEIGDGDVRALSREQHGDRPADAGIAAGDQRNLAVELLRAQIEGRIIHWRRFDAPRCPA